MREMHLLYWGTEQWTTYRLEHAARRYYRMMSIAMGDLRARHGTGLLLGHRFAVAADLHHLDARRGVADAGPGASAAC